MKLASRPPLRRLLELDRMLRASRYPNAVSAAAELEVAARTIHRDLAFLRDSWGAPLAFDRERNGYFYTDPDYALPLLRLFPDGAVPHLKAELALERHGLTLG